MCICIHTMITDQNKAKLLNLTTAKLIERLPLMSTSVLKTTATTNATINITRLQNNSSSSSSSTLNNQNMINNMDIEKIYPGIYLTSAKNSRSTEYLKLFGFTHIIYIDKHIISGDNDDNFNINNSMAVSTNTNNNIKYHSFNDINNNSSNNDSNNVQMDTFRKDHSTTNRTNATTNEILLGHNEFETLDLNFGESSYLTTVLPNCYKAVKFIDKALKNNGAVLVVDCIGGNQKCITIVIGFLMYKHNKSFLTAYQLFKRFHPNIELDRFFITQLYEYEPILQVQRTQLCGNSCSRELRSALLKRKKPYEEYYGCHTSTISTQTIRCNDNFLPEQMDILME